MSRQDSTNYARISLTGSFQALYGRREETADFTIICREGSKSKIPVHSYVLAAR